MAPSFHASVQADLNPAPTLEISATTKVTVAPSIPDDAQSVAVPIGVDEDVPGELGLDREALAAAGFDGEPGQTLVIPRADPDAPVLVAVGVGAWDELDATRIRDCAAAFARATCMHGKVAALFADTGDVPVDTAAQAVVEGIMLARYCYLALREPKAREVPLEELTLVAGAMPTDEIERGIARGEIAARATELARDLSNAPATLLTATRMAEIATALATDTGLEIEVFDGARLAELGCGGILGVNAGSAEEPRMIKLTYRPDGEPVGRIALVAKGIMYDSGGISLKPNDLVHATMKTDMTGAAATLAAMASLSALGCESEVTGYLMCTDNMPGGAAMKLGDVLTTRGGKTVEVMNTDAEGRLVMSDALVLATEQEPAIDALVDIATLTGACQRALGKQRAGVIGNDQVLVNMVCEAADRADETVWQLPLDRRYRSELDSEIADLKNVGGDDAGAITAALFLEEFVGDVPWAHIDIAGTSRVDRDESWRSKGATGFGARLLIELLMHFAPPQETRH